MHAILGSIGGAQDVAAKLGGQTGGLLVQAAGKAFMSGVGISLTIGAAVAFAGAVLALVALASRPSS